MTQKKVKEIDTRFKLLNREAELATGLVAGGLSDLKNITKGDSFYYEAFYALSLGIERFLKLLLIVENPNVKLKSFGHDLNKLFQEANIVFEKDSVEDKLICFLNSFAKKDRYSIPDTLSSGSEDVSSEPIVVFSQEVTQLILEKHNFIPFKYLVNLPENFKIFHIEESFDINEDQTQLLLISKKREFIAKYSAMYIGRIVQPILKRLRDLSGPEYNNPYFYEHFPYISGDDKYFKERKTFRRR